MQYHPYFNKEKNPNTIDEILTTEKKINILSNILI